LEDLSLIKIASAFADSDVGEREMMRPQKVM